MSESKITSDDEPILLQNKIFKVVERTQLGRSGKTLRRQIVKHPGAVGIVPVFPDGRVLLIKQYRVALQETIFEIPAGTRNPGEDPLETAKRELQEETGCSGKLTYLGSIFTSPGVLQEELFLYLATDLVQGEDALEDGELIERAPKTWLEIDEMIESHELRDAKSLVALIFARRRLGL